MTKEGNSGASGGSSIRSKIVVWKGGGGLQILKHPPIEPYLNFEVLIKELQ